MKKIALHGSYYGDNFGDTLFVIHFINWLYKNENEQAPEIFLPFASDRVRKLVDVSEKRGISSLLKSDALVFFGGGYLGEPSNNNRVWSYRLIIRHLSMALIAYLLRKPYIFIGVGAGPLTHKLARKLTVFLCNKSEKTIVRDDESKDYLIDYGVKEDKVKVTADSILTLEAKDVDKDQSKLIKKSIKPNGEDDILIGVHLPVNKNSTAKLKLILNDLKRYSSKLGKYKIVLFNDFHKEDYDYIAYKLLIDKFGQDKVISVEYKNPEQLIALINELDIVITTKLHCGIVANCLGKYTLSISVHNKTIRLYKQLGLQERNVSLEDYQKGKLLEMLSDYDINTTTYNNIPSSIRKSASENKDELYQFVQKI